MAVKKKVFISFSSKETEKALDVTKHLRNAGFDCWIAPERILVGESYLSVIPKAIEESDAFILLISNESQKSFWVKSELEQAINNGIPIFPVMIEDCEITKEFSFCLSHVQIVKYDKNFQKSVEQIIRNVGEDFLSEQINKESLFSEEKSEISRKKPSTPKDNRKKKTLTLGYLGVGVEILITILFLLLAFPLFVTTIMKIAADVMTIVLLIQFRKNKCKYSYWLVTLLVSCISFSVFNLIPIFLVFYSDKTLRRKNNKNTK